MNKLELYKQAERSSNFFLDHRLGTESWQMMERNRQKEGNRSDDSATEWKPNKEPHGRRSSRWQGKEGTRLQMKKQEAEDSTLDGWAWCWQRDAGMREWKEEENMDDNNKQQYLCEDDKLLYAERGSWEWGSYGRSALNHCSHCLLFSSARFSLFSTFRWFQSTSRWATCPRLPRQPTLYWSDSADCSAM